MEIYFILCFLLSIIGFFIMVKLPYNKCMEVENDMTLKTFLFEINNHRNDGWLQQYYREKYQDRLKYLLNEKGIGTWWWWIYRWTSRQKIKG